MIPEAMVRRIDEHARAMAARACEVVESEGFAAFFPAAEGTPAYAVPVSGAAADGLPGLARLFSDRGAPLRVELSLLAWRELPPALLAAGLVPEEETPLFVCRPQGFRAASGAAIVEWVRPEADLAFVASVMRQGFELRGGPPEPAEVAGVRAALQGPLRLALARLGPAPAGSGCSAPIEAVTEISAVSTLPAARGQGVAGQIVSFLVAEHFAAGGDLCWACTPDPRGAGVLYRVGFEDAALRVSWVRAGG